MTIKELRRLVKSDLKRTGRNMLVAYLFLPGFKTLFWWRHLKWSRSHKWLLPLTCLLRFKMMLTTTRFGIAIHETAEIGEGCYIPHFGGIYITKHCRLGSFVDVYQDVTFARTQPRANMGGGGSPIVGDNVVVFAGAKILGPVTIGDGVAVGANAVVNKDVPPHVSVGGVPARIISDRGTEGMLNR